MAPQPVASTSSSANDAQKSFELLNSIQAVEADKVRLCIVSAPASRLCSVRLLLEQIYRYDAAEQKDIGNARPWKGNPNYFKNVRISATALIKMVQTF